MSKLSTVILSAVRHNGFFYRGERVRRGGMESG
jgi:hypothetical protein